VAERKHQPRTLTANEPGTNC